MIKVIFFDLGGVIFSDFFSGGEEKLAKMLNIPSKTVLDAYKKTDIPEYPKGEITDEIRWQAFIKELGLPQEKAQRCIDTYYKSYQLFQETYNYLKELRKENTYKLGILSDQPTGVAGYLREKYEVVFSLFDPDLIIISAEVKLSKKDINLAIYKLAIERSGVAPSEILFVDNSVRNIQDATHLGINTFYFDSSNQPITVLLKNLQNKLSDK